MDNISNISMNTILLAQNGIHHGRKEISGYKDYPPFVFCRDLISFLL